MTMIMKKTLLSTLIITAAAVPAIAQTSVAPREWDGVYAQKVSPNGRYVVAQDLGGNSYVMNMKTGRETAFPETYCGDGNCISDSGVLVGEDAGTSKALVMKPGSRFTPPSMEGYFVSCLEAITPSSERAVGYVMDASTQYPAVLDIESDRLMLLPYPDRDAKGEEPQGVALHAISDDGRTAAGILVDGSGFCYTPIVYIQSEAGEWEYMIPDMKPFGEEYAFGGNMAISADGKQVTVARMASDISNPFAQYYTPYIYDVATGEFSEIPAAVKDLIPIQILEDGSVMAMSSPTAFIPYTSYILTPGAEDFILFSDFMKERFPEYYPWLDETLGQEGVIGYDDDGEQILGYYIITGLVSVSNEFVTIAGGIPEGNFFSYIYYDPDRASGVEAVTQAPAKGDGIYYNLQGIPVANPERGVYIRDGKKILFGNFGKME